MAWERPRSYEVMLGFELGLTPVFLEVGVGGRLGSEPTEAPAYVWSVRLESAQHRASGTTAAEQSTLSSVDKHRTPSVGKTATSYPPAHGANSSDSIRGAELP